MALKLVRDGNVWHKISAYAPQVGSSEENKEEFRELLEEYINTIPQAELLILAGDLNAHVGERSDGYEGVHGGRGFGRRNVEGERILEMADALELKIMNTMYKKRQEHLITYKSGQNETQIDFMIVRRKDRKAVLDCKVIPGEAVVTQHR